MAPKSVRFPTMIWAVVLVGLIEWSAAWLVKATGWSVILVLGMIRTVEAAGLVTVILVFEKGLDKVGGSPRTWPAGLKIGALWSLALALIAAAIMTGLFLTGRDPLLMLRTPLPRTLGGVIIFFAVGALIGPIAEEICFRGLIYSFFRRWGVVTAVAASTTLFVVLHGVHGFPVVQIAGGLIFAMAYETSGNLMTPIVIHVLGNSAIFTLSLPY